MNYKTAFILYVDNKTVFIFCRYFTRLSTRKINRENMRKSEKTGYISSIKMQLLSPLFICNQVNSKNHLCNTFYSLIFLLEKIARYFLSTLIKLC